MANKDRKFVSNYNPQEMAELEWNQHRHLYDRELVVMNQAALFSKQFNLTEAEAISVSHSYEDAIQWMRTGGWAIAFLALSKGEEVILNGSGLEYNYLDVADAELRAHQSYYSGIVEAAGTQGMQKVFSLRYGVPESILTPAMLKRNDEFKILKSNDLSSDAWYQVLGLLTEYYALLQEAVNIHRS